MFNQKKIAIMGTGNIAKVMAKTIKKMKDVKVYAVGSRDLGRAQAFAKEFGVKKAYGSYEELVNDTKIDLIYIATPHSEHYDNMKLCIEHGIPVLCEKAFTANAVQAEEIISLARARGVFVAEAMWTRYMPMLEKIKGMLGTNIIGQPSMLTCNLGYYLINVPRMMEPSLAGGALLDLGVYTINFASMIFESEIVNVSTSATLTNTGVDASNSITITYRDGRMAVLNSTMLGASDRRGVIYGTNGYMVIENINNFESVTAYDLNHKVIRTEKAPKQITGYEYEVMACLDAIDKKSLECWAMPHAETLRIMHFMDMLRKEWGVVYPFEKNTAVQKAPEYVIESVAETQPVVSGNIEELPVIDESILVENCENEEVIPEDAVEDTILQENNDISEE